MLPQCPSLEYLFQSPCTMVKSALWRASGCEAVGQGVVGARLFDVGIPALLRDAPAEAEEDQPLRRRDRSGGGGKASEAE